MKDDITVGDISSTEKGSGARRNSGKPQYSLVPLHLLAGCARVFMGGKLKYAPFNWAKGMPFSVPFDCLMRHLFAWFYCREEDDYESGSHHLDNALCNLLMLRHYVNCYSEGDDRAPDYAMFRESLPDFKTVFDAVAYFERNPHLKQPQRNDHNGTITTERPQRSP
jgi:hypothetical protein